MTIIQKKRRYDIRLRSLDLDSPGWYTPLEAKGVSDQFARGFAAAVQMLTPRPELEIAEVEKGIIKAIILRRPGKQKAP
jgi:hypothetical protein